MAKSIEEVREIVKGDIKSNSLGIFVGLGAIVVSGGFAALSAAIGGWDGLSIALAIIVTTAGLSVLLAAVVVIRAVYDFSDQAKQRAKRAASIVAVILVLLLVQHVNALVQELRQRQQPADPIKVRDLTVENQLRDELRQKGDDLQEARTGGDALRDEAKTLKADIAKLATDNARLTSENQRLREQLRDKRDIQAALRALASQKEEWDGLHRRTATICKVDQVGSFPTDYTKTSRGTRETLERLGYGEYSDDFSDMSNCPASGVPNACLAGGFNTEATKWYGSVACRIRNLRAIIDRLRARESSLQ